MIGPLAFWTIIRNLWNIIYLVDERRQEFRQCAQQGNYHAFWSGKATGTVVSDLSLNFESDWRVDICCLR